MLTGFLIAVLLNIPLYAWIFGKDIGWATGFPIGWCGRGLDYMVTFFHEIGHAIFAWFYGYLALPSFDFQHGGGMSYTFARQSLAIMLVVNAGVLYGAYYFRDEKMLMILFIALALTNVGIGLTRYHQSVIDFMGAGFVPLVAGFFLMRAIYDLAPRGIVERAMNAIIGFGMIFASLIEGYGLLNSRSFRTLYFEQKGQHGFGDFDKIADNLSFATFNGVVYTLLTLSLLCLIIPFVTYMLEPEDY